MTLPRLTVAAVFAAGPALADPGHIVDAAGHDHWIALGALGVAIGLAAWAGLRGRKGKHAETGDGDGAAEEAPAR
ncbi:hypothetical protein GE300_14005 [Rhodobacteraceae bacterium 2CG4]|uniref:Uncharacterized protein n=1 Tax=Halovulum marinum TaxID=2662447 RepID=A0A6L5Z3Q7_9RHOB|nr:DUF6732 family protein [Halovulum marinum]MSU90715.1 hypothetical protein [Halovulum marinum]